MAFIAESRFVQKLLGPHVSSEVTMPYATGEIPIPGDYVKNDLEQPGTVTRLRMASNGDDFGQHQVGRWWR